MFRSHVLIGKDMNTIIWSALKKKLIQECNVVVKPSIGLHASTMIAKSVDKSVSWDDIGQLTITDSCHQCIKDMPDFGMALPHATNHTKGTEMEWCDYSMKISSTRSGVIYI